MEVNKKTLIVGVFAMLLFGVVLISASSYMGMNELHEKMMASDDFEEMHAAMMNGDFDEAEKYHETLDYECPMHELVTDGTVSLDEFAVMHQWRMTGNFPEEQPKKISDAMWELHMSHHPELYK